MWFKGGQGMLCGEMNKNWVGLKGWDDKVGGLKINGG